MAGEQVAFRRAALGSPISEQSRLIDRARVNSGGRGVGNSNSAETATGTVGKTVTASATPHAVGLYTELIASTPFAAETLIINLTAGTLGSGVNSSSLLNIAFGAAASEVVKIANINVGFSSNVQQMIVFFAIPAGTRISASIQGAVVSQACGVSAYVRQSGSSVPAAKTCTTLGADTATSNGLVPATATSVNVKSAWNEIVASAAANYNQMLVSVGATSTTAVTAGTGLIDIGKGVALSEVVIVENIQFETTTAELIVPRHGTLAYHVDIDPGDRLAWRYQSTSTATNARPTVCVHLFN